MIAGARRQPSRAWSWVRRLLALVVAWLLLVAILIVAAGSQRSDGPADVAIVLGAAVAADKPTPVFRERIRHAVDLYRRGRVRQLIFTGAVGAGDRLAESVVGARTAMAAGVPRAAIRVETRSHTTAQNIDEAAKLLRPSPRARVLIVSDPLHVLRGVSIARDRGLDAAASPTPTSRYRGLVVRAEFLLRELYFTHVFLLTGG